MADETKNEDVTQEQEQGTQSDLMKALIELKKNTVSRDEYNKLKAENSELVNCIVNGQEADIAQPEEKVDCNELRNKLFGGELNNLEYAKTALALRDQIMKEGGKDPFLPYGLDVSPTKADMEAAEEVVEALESCIEVADGDADVFTNELQRILVDNRPKIRR